MQTRGGARATGGGGPGGYSRVRSYFHTPFASPSARRSPPPPLPLPPAPGRRPSRAHLLPALTYKTPVTLASTTTARDSVPWGLGPLAAQLWPESHHVPC